MAYDEGLAEVLRADLAAETGVIEKKMFGGICFMLNGNMLCGVHKGGGMFRVGKENHATALGIDGTGPMDLTGRPMRGWIDASDKAMADDDRRGRLMALAREYVDTLLPK